ncbi:MAG: SpoIIE family protein phosphatase [Clostridia bacterium]|nr:SpoIIE family protein phosphatase [Clostridia bacterium]
MTEEQTKTIYEKPSVHTAKKETQTKKNSEKKLLPTLLTAVLGFLFGGTELPFSLMPFGSALVAALPKYTASALLGILLRSILILAMGGNLPISAVCSSILLLSRIILNIIVFGTKDLSRLRRLPDSLTTKLLLCALFVFGISFADALTSGISFSALLTAGLSAIVSTGFTLVFAFFFNEEYKDSPVFEAGLGAVIFAAVLSCAPFAFGGFSIGLTAAFSMTFLIGFLGVPTRSASVGLLCGLAVGDIFAPVLSLAGLVTGIFSKTYAIFGGISAAIVTVCTGLYFGGTETVLAFLPELSVSASVVTTLAVFDLLPEHHFPEYHKNGKDTALAVLAEKQERERTLRMYGLSGALDSLSCLVQDLSERFRRPNRQKLTEKCRNCWSSYCANCFKECSARDLNGKESALVDVLIASGKIDREKLYEIIRIRCPHLDDLAEEITAISSKMLQEAIREDKTRVFAFDYETMAKIFADAAENDTQTVTDPMLSERLRRAYRRAGLRAENVLVCGERKKTVIVTGEEIAEAELRPADIRLICEGICGIGFGKPVFMKEGGKHIFMMESLPVYTVESVIRQLPKQGEFVCGDSISSAVSNDGYFYCYLCDGMGSGEEASLTSGLCSVFLEKMLVSGNKKSITLDMLNHLLCSRNTECFATVDICEIDLVCGIASFLKCGAVPSFVMRSGHLYKISAGTFPIGILSQVSAEVTDFELRAGDVIILCSDGIVSDPDAADGEDAVRFLDLITREWTDDLTVMAEKILAYSSDFSMRSDDMTVALLRVKRG